MRTTLTLDKDVEKLLREAMHRGKCSFKDIVNNSIRAGLAPKRQGSKNAKFKVKARPLGLMPGIDPAALNRMADELEAEAFCVQEKPTL